MIHDASRHATECLKYMAQLRNHEVFCFCAIPQIMAIATLQNCYNNGQVFEGVVKLRRGQTAKARVLLAGPACAGPAPAIGRTPLCRRHGSNLLESCARGCDSEERGK